MTSLAITGLGAVTPVGLSAPASAAAFRASIARLTSLQVGEEHGPEGAIPPRTGGRVPLEWFGDGPRTEDWPGHERFEVPIPEPEHLLIENGVDRLMRIAIPAATECWQQAIGVGIQPRDWGLFLGLPAEEEAATGPRLFEGIRAALNGFQPAMTAVVPEGRAAGLVALHNAAAAIANGRIAGAMVGGVDSLIRPKTFERLAAEGIVKGPANESGILPGEAAAFLIIEKQPCRGRKLALMQSSSVSDEPTAGTEIPNQAQGLTAVLRAIRTSVSMTELPLFICDLNGDRYRALEWGMALTRVFGNLHEKPDTPTSGEFWHPADCIGDTGAASGLVNCIWAVEALRKRYAQVNQVLVWGASESRLRAAVMVSNAN